MMGELKQMSAKPPGEFFPLKAEESSAMRTSFQRGQAIVGTTYFYWYDAASKAHIVNGDGSDALTTHPADMAGISFKSAAWHKAQLADMIDAGIDFLMPVFWGVPGKYDGWSFAGLPPLVEAHTAMEKEGLKPPAIGMFYDTSILQWNGSNADGSNYHVDLTTDRGREWFYAAIRDFWVRIPPQKWARVDGRPIIFLYDAAFAKKQDPERQFRHVKARFKEDFGVEPFIVKSAGWQGEADATYSWGGAVNGPIIFRETVSLGPGYDHSAVPGRQPLIVERRDGRTYVDRWTKALQLDPKVRPWMVHVETWNEWHEGTDVCALPRVRPQLHRPDAALRRHVAHRHAASIPLGLCERGGDCLGREEADRPGPAGQRRRRSLGNPVVRRQPGRGYAGKSAFAELAATSTSTWTTPSQAA